jgi:hypothetical protein
MEKKKLLVPLFTAGVIWFQRYLEVAVFGANFVDVV